MEVKSVVGPVDPVAPGQKRAVSQPPSGVEPDLAPSEAKLQPHVAPNAVPAVTEPPAPTRTELALDERTGRVVGRRIDTETGAVLDQFPSEALMKLFAINQELLGELVDSMA